MIDIIYKRPWLTIFGINVVAVSALIAAIAVWAEDASLLKKALWIAHLGALIFTMRLSWGWRGAERAVWRKRYVQAAVIWAVLFAVLAFVLLGMR